MSSFDSGVIDRAAMELKNYSIKAIDEDGAELTVEQAELLAFFEDRTGGTRLARRSDFHPAELKAFLPGICIVEPILDENDKPVDARFRLMGTAVSAAYGEMTGKLASEHTNAEVSARFFKMLELAIYRKTAVFGWATSGEGSDGIADSSPAPTAHILFIPLSEDGETIDQVLFYSDLK